MRVAGRWAAGPTGAALCAVLLSGCAAGSVATSVGGSGTTTLPTTEPFGAQGSALSFDLPAELGYQLSDTRVTDDGAVVRQWRMSPDENGLYCVLIAGEQPDFRGAFPASAVAAFRAGRDPGGAIQVNQATTAIPGTVAGVRQQSTYTFSLGTAGSATGVLLIRQYVTTDGTLISLNAAAPTDQAEHCQLASIVESLRASSPSDHSPADPSPERAAQPTTKEGQ